MEVKPGYRQSEVGIIPQDWRIEPIEQISTVGRGRVISHREIARSLNPRYPVYSSQTSNNGVMGYLDTFEFEGKYITWTTDGANAGTVFARNGKFNCTNVCGTIKLKSDNHLFVAKVLGRIAPRYVSRHLGNPKLMNDVMKRVKIPLPPTKAEQEAIAEALSDADALIESLEQLLAKKRQLKQGAMQELLTGKKRLPGFSGEWEVNRLDELGRWTGGMTPSMRNPDYWHSGTMPWISSGDVKSVRLTTTTFAISDYAVKQRATTLLPAKSIIVVTRSGILRKYLPVAMNMIPMAINQDIKALLPNDHVLPEYLLHSITCNGDRILARCLKSGTTVESIEFPWLKAFTIPIPALLEQAAIAGILSDMDAELAALEAKLAKARQLKQGMMQELLTGSIRLV